MVFLRFATLNIRHGGGGVRRASKIPAALLALDADVLVISEFRNNAVGEVIKNALGDQGYTISHPETLPARNTVMVACRSGLSDFDTSVLVCAEHDGRLWQMRVGDIIVCGVYLPNGLEKKLFWEMITDLAKAAVGNPIIFIGDFNTGRNDLDKDARGTAFVSAPYMDEMDRLGQFDLYRALHGKRREYSWFSSKGNGFRLDHAFGGQAVRDRLVGCFYDHSARLDGTTDHSALVLELEMPFIPTTSFHFRGTNHRT